MTGMDPHHRDDLDEEGIPDLETPVNEDEGLIPPRDYPQAVEEYGVTAAEQRGDEPLSERVLREEPDFGQPGYAADDNGGLHARLIDPADEDVDDIDDEKDAIGFLVEDEGALSAEEAAIHITETP
jgi:hypothetical protein